MIQKTVKDSLKLLISKNVIYESIFVLLFILSIINSSISNYNIIILIIKTISSLILVFYFLILQIKVYKQNFHFNIKATKKLVISSMLISVISFSSLYIGGFNTLGLQKYYLILVQVIPITIVSCLAVSTWNEARTKAFFFVTISIGLVASIISGFISPFNPFIEYNFSFSRWSHVVFGRFIIVPIIYTFFLMHNTKDKKLTVIYFIIATMMFFTLFSTGFRAGIFAAIAFLISLLIYTIIVKKEKSFSFKNLLIIGLLLTSPLIIFYSQQAKLLKRIEGLEQIVAGKKIEDGSLNTRIKAYEIVWKRGFEKPIFGNGLGSFQFSAGSFSRTMKYPHNIFLEFFYEFGLIGIIFISYLLTLIIKNLFKTNFWIISIYLIYFWFSLFSKDIPSNAILFCGLALLNFTKKKPPNN